MPELFVEGDVALHVGRDRILQHPTPILHEKRPYNICPTSPYINEVGPGEEGEHAGAGRDLYKVPEGKTFMIFEDSQNT